LQQEQEQQQEDREAAAGQHWKETMAAALEDAHRLSAAAERLMEVRDETTVVAAAPAVVVPAPAVVWPQGEVVAQWLEAPDEPTASPPPPSVARVTSRAPPPAGRLTVMRAEGNIPLMHRDPRCAAAPQKPWQTRTFRRWLRCGCCGIGLDRGV